MFLQFRKNLTTILNVSFLLAKNANCRSHPKVSNRQCEPSVSQFAGALCPEPSLGCINIKTDCSKIFNLFSYYICLVLLQPGVASFLLTSQIYCLTCVHVLFSVKYFNFYSFVEVQLTSIYFNCILCCSKFYFHITKQLLPPRRRKIINIIMEMAKNALLCNSVLQYNFYYRNIENLHVPH